MSNVILHIGPHKSGTSALQEFFFINRSLLLDHGVVYEPMNESWNNHHPLVVAFREPAQLASGQAWLAEVLERHADKRILISSEMLCEDPLNRAAFLECFDGHDVKTIGYLRNSCDLIVSAFNEMVRDANLRWTHPLGAAQLGYDPSLYNILREWITQGSLTLCPYDPPQWRGGTIFSDFLSNLDISPEGFELPAAAVNQSLPYPLVEILRSANIVGLEGENRRQLLNCLRDIDAKQDQYPLGHARCAELLQAFAGAVDHFRPFYRAGFDETYLFANPGHPDPAPAA